MQISNSNFVFSLSRCIHAHKGNYCLKPLLPFFSFTILVDSSFTIWCSKNNSNHLLSIVYHILLLTKLRINLIHDAHLNNVIEYWNIDNSELLNGIYSQRECCIMNHKSNCYSMGIRKKEFWFKYLVKIRLLVFGISEMYNAEFTISTA